MDVEGTLPGLTLQIACWLSGLWFAMVIVGRPPSILRPAPQSGMAECFFQFGQLWLNLLNGGLSACFGGVDEVIGFGATQSTHGLVAVITSVNNQLCERFQTTGLLLN